MLWSAPGARVAVVTDPADPLAADVFMVRWAQVGKPVVSWCSMTDQGRRVARELASTLNPHLEAAGNGNGDPVRVRHIVKDPRTWQPLVDPFESLVAGARKTVPGETACVLQLQWPLSAGCGNAG